MPREVRLSDDKRFRTIVRVGATRLRRRGVEDYLMSWVSA